MPSLPKQKESHIVTAILTYLSYEEAKGNLYALRINAGAIISSNGGFVRLARTGVSDIIIFLKGGRTIFIEAKTSKGKMSPGQITFRETIEKLGYAYHVVRSVDDVINILKK